MAYPSNVDILNEIKPEVERFLQKLNLAIDEQSESKNYSSRHFASAKRGAIDLKHELTKLTQSSKYKYGTL